MSLLPGPSLHAVVFPSFIKTCEKASCRWLYCYCVMSLGFSTPSCTHPILSIYRQLSRCTSRRYSYRYGGSLPYILAPYIHGAASLLPRHEPPLILLFMHFHYSRGKQTFLHDLYRYRRNTVLSGCVFRSKNNKMPEKNPPFSSGQFSDGL